MYVPAMKLSLLVSLLLIGIVRSIELAALATDSQQPIEIQADFAELDDRDGKTIYIGNVIVIQGSIKMTGDKLRVNFSADRDLEEVFLEGRPATFKQTPDKGDDVKGEALRIEYHALKGFLHLIHKARLTQGKRLFEGDRINYDTENAVITARAAPRSTDANGRPRKRGRVRVIIPPKASKKCVENDVVEGASEKLRKRGCTPVVIGADN
ncbi:MAG: lipopolysaccharide transport periplasmic protein LptA [Proteobacteria bacterium]|nr:MAG: lipopolysaccharide transport periplasmic protein LptA [Pseudomonadota bacterium]